MTEPRARLWLLHFPDPSSIAMAQESAVDISGRCWHFLWPELSDGYCTGRDDLAHVHGFMHDLSDDGGARCSAFDEGGQ